tara:strand:+ start:240 stop:1106 length:867 start_codon:yes stop_codon:yes gene_type:complete
MPELPEVEVVKRSLKSKIQNLVIKKVKINDSKLRYKLTNKEFTKITGLKIKKIERKSKFLLFLLDKFFVILVHLGMTGKFFFLDQKNQKYKTSFYYSLSNKDYKHDRVIFHLGNGQKLIYNDVRKFGFIKILSKKNYKNNFHLNNLGPEPLEKKYKFDYFKEYISGKNRSIKDLLMDQRFVSGLGNIYVNEILFLSKVRPTRKIQTLKNYEILKIINFTKKILIKAIKNGGASIRDFSSINGKKGFFQQKFKVYGREGKNCSNIDCNASIFKIPISNRSSFFCKRCQK